MPKISTVEFSSGAVSGSGYLAHPGTGSPGIIVLQEWWGLVPHIEDVARRFAGQGYIALAPDLYHGKKTVEEAEAQHLMEGLDWSLATKEISEAVRYLRAKEGATRVGVVGFCMGGALTIISACQPGIDAYAAFYGFPPKDAASTDAITAPGIIFFGEQEEFFSVPDARAFEEKQLACGREAEVVVYPGAGHAFFNNERPEVYRVNAANDAWCRTLDLFGRVLRD